MIKRPSDVYPPILLNEFRRLAMTGKPWARLMPEEYPNYRCEFFQQSWLRSLCGTASNHPGAGGSDAATMISAIEWIANGPKIVHVTPEQYRALSHVDVRMELKDFSTPFDDVLYDLSDVPGTLHKYCLIHRHVGIDAITLSSGSHDHLNDITTNIRQRDGILMEESLEKYDPDLSDVAVQACQTLRVACNMSLALTNFGYQAKMIFPDEHARDERLAKEPSERGRKAAARLRESPLEVSFDRVVQLYHKEGGESSESNETGREMPFGWRRGHWAMQVHGPHNSLRKRIFRMPMMVRKDKYIESDVHKSDITTTYQ